MADAGTIARAVLRRAQAALPRRPEPSILMYHRIASETFDPWGLAVEPEMFANQVQWLARHRQVIRLEELVEHHRHGTLPAAATAITFDDGYGCFAERAAPLLGRAGLPATVFIAANLIEQQREFWWDELQTLVLAHEGPTLQLDSEDVELGAKRPEDWHWRPGAEPATPRQQAFRRLWAALKAKPARDRHAAMEEFRQQSGSARPVRPSHRPMRAEEVRALSADVEFGSHGLSHESLPTLPRAAKAEEIGRSVERWEALTGEPPRSFAYAFGDHDDEAEQLVEAAGFVCACTTEQRPLRPDARRFALPRCHVGNWKPPRLRQVVGGK